jgi:hypothetical protein
MGSPERFDAVDSITIGAVSGQANAALNINAHRAFAFRFPVKVK